MDYPENCIRGVPGAHQQYVASGMVRDTVFYFHRDHAREDGWIEESVNWQDDEGAIHQTLTQTRANGEPQFQGGLVIVPRAELDRIRLRYAHMGVFDYERRPTSENRYHGNLLLKVDMLETPLMKAIASVLAVYSFYHPRGEFNGIDAH